MLALLLFACVGGRQATPPTLGVDSRTLACAADADCVVTCEHAGSCCPDGCSPCENVMNRATFDSMHADNEATCARKDVECPVYDCDIPHWEPIPRCTSGACTIEKKPIERAP